MRLKDLRRSTGENKGEEDEASEKEPEEGMALFEGDSGCGRRSRDGVKWL